jgi:hypothetical protein
MVHSEAYFTYCRKWTCECMPRIVSQTLLKFDIGDSRHTSRDSNFHVHLLITKPSLHKVIEFFIP